MKLALIVSDSHVARAAGDALRAKYDFVPVREADVVVALGGDGHLLHCLHAMCRPCIAGSLAVSKTNGDPDPTIS